MIVARVVIGILLVMVGVVWIGQGINLIHGSTMTGSTFWAAAGAVCVVCGLAVFPWRRTSGSVSGSA